MGLVTKEGNRYVPNPKAEIAQEILTYLKREHSYGEKVTGAKLAEEFGGLGYGWSPDIVRLVLAVLFRAGAIEVTHQSRRYRNYQEPQARAPFTTHPAFRAASFAPRESIDLKTLTKAVQELEQMLGREVDVEESAIAEEFQKLARSEREQILPAMAQAKAYSLPVVQPLEEWRQTLDSVISGQPDDCVRMLAGEGKSLKEQREAAQRIEAFLARKENIETVQHAGSVVRDQAQLLIRSTGQDLPSVEIIKAGLADSELPARIKDIAKETDAIDSAYRARFFERHSRRREAYEKAIEEVKEQADYRAADLSEAEQAIAGLLRRVSQSCELAPYSAVDRATGSTLATLDDDIELLPSLKAGALSRLAQRRDNRKTTEEAVEIVRLGDFLPKTQALSDFSDQEIEDAIEKLRLKLYALRELKRRALWD